ncbi:solute carrier organic anion transporter family member 4A1-like [Clavelina lepadiformis]|uniref:solute carrier organic anion transporter family member 4A1-like n=1 Tax=Clavelina lepadiformis TaxID=159417 RepID=UPI0040424EE0
MECSKDNNADLEELNLDEHCGCQSYTCCVKRRRYPVKYLQQFATPKWALALLCCLGFLQGFVISGLVNVVITTIEKRFGLSSAESGLVVSSYNIASCLAIPIVTYIGGKGHKPLWIGWGMILMGIGCVVFTLPHFTSAPYHVNETTNPSINMLCVANETLLSTVEDLNFYKYIFILSQIINGIGTTALYTIGMTYLDENVTTKQSSMYHGIYLAVAVALGPAAGYMLGGVTLKMYTEVGRRPDLSQTDAAWVGAWWFGFLICGVLIFIFSIPLLMFPKIMPNTEEVRQNRSNEMHRDALAQSAAADSKFGTRLKDVPKSCLVLLRNPAFIFVALANAVDFGLVAGFAAFTPKYLESMFDLNPTDAAFYLGVAVVVGGALGNILGGLIVSKGNLKVPGMMRLCILSTLAGLALSFIYFLSCDNTAFAGATVPYTNSTKTSSTDFASKCNSQCNCLNDAYSPVCGSDGVTYFSPCFAGCSQSINGTYTDCSCIEMGTATPEKCKNANCGSLAVFLIAFFFLFFFTILCWTPALQIVHRVVPFPLRALAVGIMWIFNRCFGGIPAPIVFGRVLDLACAAWSGGGSNQGSCRLYNNYEMARYSFFVVLCHKIATFILYGMGTILYKSSSQKTKIPDTVEGKVNVAMQDP